jgi:rubrerythrin
MYLSLAEDEVLHAQVIQRQADALAKGEGWVVPEGIDEVDADLETPLFPVGQAEFEKAVQPDASDLDALLFALKLENDSFDLYRRQAQTVADPNAKRLYEYLVDAERTHFNLLMLNYESLNEQSTWV